jgi:hypothetical protein
MASNLPAGQYLSIDFVDDFLSDITRYEPDELAIQLSNLFSNGIMFRMTSAVDDVLYRVSNGDVTDTERQTMVAFLTELAQNTPPRFIEMLKWDTLYTLNSEVDWVYDVRSQPSRERRDYIQTRAGELERQLLMVRPPRTTERYRLEYEDYRENEETRQRFVLVYQE